MIDFPAILAAIRLDPCEVCKARAKRSCSCGGQLRVDHFKRYEVAFKNGRIDNSVLAAAKSLAFGKRALLVSEGKLRQVLLLG